MADIADRTDITALVTDFYSRAFADDLLGPIFIDVARMDLAAHLPVMVDFWETVLFRSGTYRRKVLHLHIDLNRREPLTERHFRRWLTLWHTTVDDRHAGPKAELAKVQATRIAQSMRRRLAGERPQHTIYTLPTASPSSAVGSAPVTRVGPS